MELGGKLANEGHNLCTTPSEVLDEVEALLKGDRKFEVFPEAQAGLMLDIIDDMMIN